MTDTRNKPDNIRKIIDESPGPLSSICSRAHTIIELQNNLKAELPAPLDEHVAIANYTKDTLIIQTDSSAWAAKLRYKIPELLTILKNKCGLPELKTIRVKISIRYNIQQPPENRLFLSSQTSNFLNKIANSISDSDLRESLVRISRHTK